MTKILILSDTHYRIGCPDDSILKLASAYDHIIHAGDYVNDDFETELEVIGSFFGVAGNNDPWSLYDKLGRKKLIEIEGVRIGINHGDGSWQSPLEASKKAFKGSNADIVIFGHSHVPLILREDKTLFVNPGSYSLPRSGSARSFAVLTLNDGKIQAEIISRTKQV
jgi:uncharacterized protein